MTTSPNFKLIVINPFNGFNRGDEITNPEQVQEISSTENEINVRKVIVEHANPIAPIVDQE